MESRIRVSGTKNLVLAKSERGTTRFRVVHYRLTGGNLVVVKNHMEQGFRITGFHYVGILHVKKVKVL